jgi:hypothetical protein
MENKYEQRLQKLIPVFYRYFDNEFEKKVIVARNKRIIAEDLIKDFNSFKAVLSIMDDYQKNLISKFSEDFSRGIPIDELIITESTKIQKNITDGIEINSELIGFSNPYRMVILFAKFAAYHEFIKSKKNIFDELYDENNQVIYEYRDIEKALFNLTDIEFVMKNITSEIVWTGSKINFIKIMYALFLSGNINDGKGQITKIIPDAAKLLGVKNLGAWSSDLSMHLNTTKKDDLPVEIFYELHDVFKDYAKKIKDKKT